MKKLSMLETIQVHGIWGDMRSQTGALSLTRDIDCTGP